MASLLFYCSVTAEELNKDPLMPLVCTICGQHGLAFAWTGLNWLKEDIRVPKLVNFTPFPHKLNINLLMAK